MIGWTNSFSAVPQLLPFGSWRWLNGANGSFDLYAGKRKVGHLTRGIKGGWNVRCGEEKKHFSHGGKACSWAQETAIRQLRVERGLITE